MQKTIFSKSSIERKDEYKIITRIYEEDGVKRVEKSAQNEKAVPHVEQMADFAKENPYLTENVFLVPCEKTGTGKVVMPYVAGKRLDQQMDEHVKQKDWNGVYSDITLLKDIITNVKGKTSFASSEAFETMFGAFPQLEGYDAAANVSIDMVSANIILGEKIYVLDYEWNFDFLIPLKFILYRSILLNGTLFSLPEERQTEILAMVGISDSETETFHQMEIAFQSYITGVSLNNLYQHMPIKNYRMNTNELGNNIYAVKAEIEEKEVVLDYRVFHLDDFPQIVLDTKEYPNEVLKLQLTDKPCIIKQLEVSGFKDGNWEKTDFTDKPDMYLYEQNYYSSAPAIFVPVTSYDKIQVKYKVQKLDADANGYIGTYIKEVAEDRELQLIKNGKAFKTLTAIKKILGRK